MYYLRICLLRRFRYIPLQQNYNVLSNTILFDLFPAVVSLCVLFTLLEFLILSKSPIIFPPECYRTQKVPPVLPLLPEEEERDEEEPVELFFGWILGVATTLEFLNTSL